MKARLGKKIGEKDFEHSAGSERRSGLGDMAQAYFRTARPEKLALPETVSRATYSLRNERPDLSAYFWLTGAQIAGLVVFVIAALAAGYFYPAQTVISVNAIFAVFFASLIILRLVTFAVTAREHEKSAIRPDENLPVYTILVPLFKEANILPQLARALMELDYPSEKLDIKLIFEQEDMQTLEAARSLDLPAQFEFVIIPPALPQTKPKALNVALDIARGEYVTIYDAEDIPAPDQLRSALSVFKAGDDNLACIQARLGYYNPRDNWLTRQFTLEYAGLFHVLLPALVKLRLPVLLGGTSNHFRTEILKAAGGWDAHNVTEDADLGIRLERLGYSCGVFDSDTFEEASGDLLNWLAQRSRWLKGWMQTYAVHMRNPYKLWSDLGPRGFLAFQALAGGMVVSALAHPIFLTLLIITAIDGHLFDGIFNLTGQILLFLNGFNLAMGYLAAAAISMKGAAYADKKDLFWHALFIPFYWLLISAGAYIALWQFFTKPFYWEKTGHGLSPNMPEGASRKSETDI